MGAAVRRARRARRPDRRAHRVDRGRVRPHLRRAAEPRLPLAVRRGGACDARGHRGRAAGCGGSTRRTTCCWPSACAGRLRRARRRRPRGSRLGARLPLAARRPGRAARPRRSREQARGGAGRDRARLVRARRPRGRAQGRTTQPLDTGPRRVRAPLGRGPQPGRRAEGQGAVARATSCAGASRSSTCSTRSRRRRRPTASGAPHARPSRRSGVEWSRTPRSSGSIVPV